jgi:pyruvate/2-oxoglutarate dehydrogenase complex dihydrolipoamide acyltransferase (E2) component
MQKQYIGDKPTIYRHFRVLPGEVVTVVHDSDLVKMPPELWADWPPDPGPRTYPETFMESQGSSDIVYVPSGDWLDMPQMAPRWGTQWEGKNQDAGSTDASEEPDLPGACGEPGVAGSTADPDTGANVTPAALALAEEHGLDLDGVTGTGQDSRILVRDVKRLIGG